MLTLGVKGAQERARKSASGARAGAGAGAGPGAGEKRRKGPRTTEPPKTGWALTQQRLVALTPTLRQRHLLFGDFLDDIGKVASMFPRESVELPYNMPDPRTWSQALDLPSEHQNRFLGLIKAAEARGRVHALRLRYTRMRAEEISLLIQKQNSARAAIRLELFLPPQLKPTKIPDPLDRQERRRVETILEEEVDGNIFPR